MLIQRIKISNYKTYLSLDLDLTVDDDRPIILIGGANGGGKTTLFEAISGALYGLKIENKEHFMELLNQGALNTAKPEISLQITFVGKVLGQQQKYILKRVYQLNPQGKPLESVSLNMNGNMYVYGTMTAPKDRVKAEQEINKIIKANLPQELSQYFLFDAMQSSELLKKNVFAQTIRDNFENVLGFKKYLQLKRAAEKLQQEWAQQRLEAEKEAQEYNELCAQKDKLTADLNTCIAEQDTKYKYLASVEVEYKRAKDGAQEASALNKKIQELASKIDDIVKRAASALEIRIKEGTYIQLSGPQFETPHEVAMCRTLGADAVGMSTACEAIAAKHMGMKVLGISCISNLASGISSIPLSHAEVQETADAVAPKFKALVTETIKAIGAQQN